MTTLAPEAPATPFGLDLMVPVGELVNLPTAGKTGYTTTYVNNPNGGKDQKKDDDED